MRATKTVIAALVLAAVFSLGSTGARGAILAEDTWTGAGLDDWTSLNVDRDGPGDGTLSNPGGWLMISNTVGGGLTEDYIFENNNLVGNYLNFGVSGTSVFSIVFNFFVSNQVPDQVSLYFMSPQSGTDWFWYYKFTPVLGWNSLYANLDLTAFNSGWRNEQVGRDTFTEFQNDLSDVDEIGILLLYHPNASQIYGLDNFQLSDLAIPEPGTYAMLGCALLSLAVPFRRRLRETWGCALKRLRKT